MRYLKACTYSHISLPEKENYIIENNYYGTAIFYKNKIKSQTIKMASYNDAIIKKYSSTRELCLLYDV